MLTSNGNTKIGKDTLIMNIHTSMYCPAKNMCLLRDVCYAKKIESFRASAMSFHERQEQEWNNNPASYFIDGFKKMKKDRLKFIRFQEAGDLANQDDLDKMSEISEALKGLYVCYTYTNRSDLDFTNKSDNLIITGSYFMVDNMYVPLYNDDYTLLMDKFTPEYTCPNDCRICDLCKVARGITIYQKVH